LSDIRIATHPAFDSYMPAVSFSNPLILAYVFLWVYDMFLVDKGVLDLAF
jgi:hypothetical protein